MNTRTNIKVFSVCILFTIVLPLSESFGNRVIPIRILTKQSQPDTLMLPSNATSIRENITDNFSCEDRPYGYYADVENDCQIFHVCYPVVYSDGKNQTFRWSFICPSETIFNQELFVCVREEDSSIDCNDSEDYYNLNGNFGERDPEEDISDAGQDDTNNQEENSDDTMENDDTQENADENRKRKKPVMKETEAKKPEIKETEVEKPAMKETESKKPEKQKKKNDRRKTRE